jgi:hypothetical protein
VGSHFLVLFYAVHLCIGCCFFSQFSHFLLFFRVGLTLQWQCLASAVGAIGVIALNPFESAFETRPRKARIAGIAALLPPCVFGILSDNQFASLDSRQFGRYYFDGRCYLWD